MKKRILVTGGAGFIGSNTCESLLLDGHEVICLDNFITGKRVNIASLIQNESFSLIEGDIRSIEDCRKAVLNCDVVLHLAALGSVPRSIADPITTNDININGFLNVIVEARDVLDFDILMFLEDDKIRQVHMQLLFPNLLTH